MLLVAVEGGGTSFLLSIGILHSHKNKDPNIVVNSTTCEEIIRISPTKYLEILHKTRISSSIPSETLSQCSAWLLSHRPDNGLSSYDGVGIACFGPLGVVREDAGYGCILKTTPKKEWRGVDVLKPILDACTGDSDVVPPHKVDTDVNAPAWAEFLNSDGGGRKKTSLAYVTVGTGVGLGLVINNHPVYGRMHPEGGHIAIHPIAEDTFPGYSWGAKCPYRGVNTVEGIAGSVALIERFHWSDAADHDREQLKDIPDGNDIWDHAANAIANLCVSLMLMTSIEEIVLGGGVMKREILFAKIRSRVESLLNGYLELPTDMERFIRRPTWENTGLVGAFTLAETAVLDRECNDDVSGALKGESNVKNANFWKGFGCATALFATIFSASIILNRRK